MTRLRIGWIFIALVLAGVGYAAYIVVTLPGLRVRSIDVRIDGLAVSEREVLAAANVDRQRNMWLIDTAKITRRVAAIPYVDRVDVRRTPPARLSIAVTEREPAACVHSDAQVVTIDRVQRILQSGCVRPSSLQVTLHGATFGPPGTQTSPPELGALLADAHVLTDAHVEVRSIAEDRFGQLVAVDRNRITLLFGTDGDLAEKAKLVAPVLAATQPGHRVRTLDLRAPATPTVDFR